MKTLETKTELSETTLIARTVTITLILVFVSYSLATYGIPVN